MMIKDFNILIPDIGIGNIRSLSRAILKEKEFINKLVITNNPKDVSSNSCIIFPGVGNFGEVMHRLVDTGWEKALKIHLKNDRLFIGICVGYQILFQNSEESNCKEGLNLLPFNVKKLKDFDYLPLIGYKDTFCNKGKKIGNFYFIHSYGIEITEKVERKLERIEYYYYNYKNKKILAGIKTNNYVGLQFHPEKSKISGVKFLNKLIKTLDFC